MRKRKIAALMAVLLAGMQSLTACGTGAKKTDKSTEGNKSTSEKTEVTTAKETTAKKFDKSTMTFLYPGDESERMTEFLNNAFKDRMTKDLNLEVKMIFQPWDQYWAQKDIMLAAQEPIDLFWDGLPNLSQIINKKQAQSLDKLVAEYGADLNKVIPEIQMSGGKVNGQLYGIPSSFSSSSGMYQFVTLREDLLKGVGMTKVETPEDLTEYAEKVKANYPQTKGPADTIFKPLTRYFQPEPYTFTVKEELIVFGEDSKKVYSYYETDAFKKVAKFNRSMFEKGLYTDELATKYNERTSRIQTGLYIWGEGSVGKDLEIGEVVKQNVPEAVMKNYILAPEKPKYITSTGGEVLAIPVTAPNPVGAMRFINWFYSNEENYMFAIYGEQGKDYTLENGKINRISKNDFFYEWMFRNKNYQKFGTDITDEYIKEYKSWDDSAKISSILGFSFDNKNVKAIETKVLEVAGKQMAPIRDGFVDFDSNYDAAVKALKEAGIDEYIAEIQKQIDEFLAKKK